MAGFKKRVPRDLREAFKKRRAMDEEIRFSQWESDLMWDNFLKGGDFLLCPENRDAWSVFLACNTQWNYTNGQRVGLRYESVMTVMDFMGMKNAETFNKVQHLEMVAMYEAVREEDG